MRQALFAPIIVVGSYRGGTSAVAGVLHILGIDMGIKHDSPLQNEDKEMTDLGRLEQNIRTRAERGRPWGWKDPAFIERADFILPKLPASARFVVVTRDPRKVANSMQRFDAYKLPPNEALQVARMRQELVQRFLEQHTECFNMGDFDAFRANPRPMVARLCQWLGANNAKVETAAQYPTATTYTPLGEYR